MDESLSPSCFKEDEEMPFFLKGRSPEITIMDVIDIVMSEHSSDYICVKQPMHVQQNAVFLINTAAIPLQDLPADDNGIYRDNGSRVWTYDVQQQQKKMIAKRALKEGKASYITVKRTYRKNKSCDSFHQIVVYAEDRGQIVNNLAVLQYLYKGEDHRFEVKAHGNKKDKTVPYFPVSQSTREKIKDCVAEQKSRKAMGKLSSKKPFECNIQCITAQRSYANPEYAKLG